MELNSSDRYEIKATAFYRMTGHMAPGKDRPAVSGSDDEYDVQKEWWEWNGKHGALIELILDATEIRLTL